MVVMDNDGTSDDGKENDDLDRDSDVICSVNGMDDDGMDGDGTGNIDTT